MKVFAIIVTYNGLHWIDWCLSSLRNSTVPIVPVVVDNGSTDGLRDYVPEHYPEVVWLPQDGNLGFGLGNNVGMKYAMENGADYVLLLNQDAALAPNALGEMLAVANDRDLVSPVHLRGDGKRVDFMFRESLKRANNELFDDFLIDGCVQPTYELLEVCAACWLMPIGMLREVGGFCPLFFQYGEDNNYYTRLVYQHRKVILATKARMMHDRKVHGNAALFNKKELRIRSLVVACDPNLSLMSRIKKLLLLGAKGPLREMAEMCFLLSKMRQIKKVRKAERAVTSNWL